MNILVIDTNILISALIKEGLTREILTNLRINFICPENALKSIYSYKEEIIEKSKLDEKTFNIILLRLLKHVNLIPLDIINGFKEEADKIIGKIDKEDTIFIATALAFNCPIWSNDNHFQKQKIIKIFKTKDILNLLK